MDKAILTCALTGVLTPGGETGAGFACATAVEPANARAANKASTLRADIGNSGIGWSGAVEKATLWRAWRAAQVADGLLR